MTVEVAALIPIVAAVGGAYFGWKGHARAVKAEVAAQASKSATMETNVQFIKDNMTRMLATQDEHSECIAAIDKRVEHIDTDVEHMKGSIKTMCDAQSTHDKKISNLDTASARHEEKLTSMNNDLESLKKKVFHSTKN